MEITKDIEVPASSLARKDAVADAKEVVRAAEDLQGLVASEAKRLMMVANEGVQGDIAAGSETAAPEAGTGIPDSPHSNTIIEVESHSTQSSSSQSTSSLYSSELDDLPIGLVYKTTKKDHSSTTKIHKKPAVDTTQEPVRSDIDERIIGMSQRKADFYNRFPVNNPLKPPMIPPLNVVPADAEFTAGHIGSELSNPLDSSSSQPPSSTKTTPKTNVLDNLVSHYSGELPGVEPNLQRASEVTSMKVASESPQQQAPNQQMASTTCPDHASKTVPEHIAPEYIVPEQYFPGHILTPASPEAISESDFMITSDVPDVNNEQSSSTMIEKSILDKPTTRISTPNFINNQPSTSITQT
jgi:hypothetical protein